MIINGYFKLSRGGRIYKGSLDISDSGKVKTMYGKLVRQRPDASFKELKGAYGQREIYVSSKDFILFDDKAIVTKGVRI